MIQNAGFLCAIPAVETREDFASQVVGEDGVIHRQDCWFGTGTALATF